MKIEPSILFPGTAVGLKVVSALDGNPVSSLEENGRYEYELDRSLFALQEVRGIITPSQIRPQDEADRGLIEPGSYVGLLKLVLLDQTRAKVAETYIDVCSSKLGYEDEYRSMLEEIADRCADFLLQLDSPVEQQFVPDDEVNEATLAQRLYFLKGLLGGEEFQQAVQRIISMPNTRWGEEYRTLDVRRSQRLGRYEVRQFVGARRRIPVPDTHPFRDVMPTVPEVITIRDKRDTVDTPENRFVKHAMSVFLHTLEDMQALLPTSGNDRYPGLLSEIRELIDGLEETVAHDVFKQVSSPEFLPLNSPVLQRREGYRQVLRAWILFELAAKLSWSGGDDVYAGGKRDAAALYEYWVFFKLLDLVSRLFELTNPPVHELLDNHGLVLKLKAGRHLPITGIYDGAGRRLHVLFSYNRTFGAARKYPDQGSWSRQMRPDYTLSLWPYGFSQEEAEREELITHVHFDAKYRVQKLVELFGNENEQALEEEAVEERRGKYKRADLLKMHAYRDSIRRSAGAYVLYPGDEFCNFKGFHELLPGLGAFPLRPNTVEDGTSAIERFLKEIVAHVCNRATQREQSSYHQYRIHRTDPPDCIANHLPEKDDLSSRVRPPSEQFVLHGWVSDKAHLEWIRRHGYYNYRTGDKRGSLMLHESVTGASLLYLHGEGQYQGGGTMFRIVSGGPRVFSNDRLLEMGYPGAAELPFYLVFAVKEVAAGDPLAHYDWDLRPIPGVDSGRGSALPKKGIPLSEFMKGARPRSS